MTWWQRLWRTVTGKARREALVAEFQARFPGKCMLCSYYRYGRRECHIPHETPTPPHECIEGNV